MLLLQPETVNLDIVPFADVFFQQKSSDLFALITMKLQNFCPIIHVFPHSSVAATPSFYCLQDTFQVEPTI